MTAYELAAKGMDQTNGEAAMKPMLATDHDPNKLQFPVYASPKLDGLRGLVHEGKLLSRSLKPIPNLHVSKILSDPCFDGFDGELVAGSPTDPKCMQNCTSFFMARDKVSQDWTFHVFDLHDSDAIYTDRYNQLVGRIATRGTPNFVIHSRKMIHTHEELLTYEAQQLALGYEGLILRKPDSPYKFGRSTVNEGYLLKVKRFTDGEAKVVGFEEQLQNNNEKTTNELGHSKRSSHKENKTGKNTLGALIVRDLVSGIEFNIGTGLDDTTRKHIWQNMSMFLGKIVKYKSFLIGVKDAPRHPVFIGFRDEKDMS